MNLFSYVKNQLSILDIVNEYTTLKKAGLYWKGTCPFHHEKTASFTVSPHKEIFYCFGCHRGGDVIAFVAAIEQHSPLEAVKQLIERYQLTIPNHLSLSISSQSTERNRYHELCKTVALWAHQQLLNHYTPLGYITERSITRASIDHFMVGYFPGGPRALKALLEYMQQYNFLANDLLQAGIVAHGRNVLYSPFEERIIFPIKDHLGRHCGFGGRIFKPNDERAKYYNSRESDYFAKGSLLFGFDQAKSSIQKKTTLFLVEGYIDCLLMTQHGFTNTVATLGTACTLEHLTTLARYAQQLYVLYDGDNAGQEAIIRLAQLCWHVNMELYVINLPAQEDPASLLTKGFNLVPLIDKAIDIFVFFINSLSKDFFTQTLSKKMQLTNKIIGLIQHIDDPLKQDILLQKAADTLKIPFQSMKEVLEKNKKGYQPIPSKARLPSPEDHSSLESVSNLEKKIFFAIMHNIQLLNKENEEYLIEYLPNPFQDILKKLKQAKDHGPLNFIQFFDMLSIVEQQYVSKVLIEGGQEEDAQDFEQLLLYLQRKHWKRIVHSIKIKLTQEENKTDKGNIETILNNFLELKKKLLNKNLI